MRKLRVAMAQINTFVGDLDYNKRKIGEFIEKAKDVQADVVSFPELAVTGYPPEDLVYKPAFVKDNIKTVKKIADEHPEVVSIVGFVDSEGSKLFNAAAVLYDGKVQEIYHKTFLPNYGVFDEKRYFAGEDDFLVFELNGINVGVNICEDIWHSYPTTKMVEYGAVEVIININSSPYNLNKLEERKNNLSLRSKESNVYIAYNNMVDGQDELVFDGSALFFDPKGNNIGQGKRFEEDLVVEDLTFDDKKREPVKTVDKKLSKFFKTFSLEVSGKEKSPLKKVEQPTFSREEEIYKALVLGVRDYVHKNGFKKALIALSGGVDSALSLTIAVDALGKENIMNLYLPSAFSSSESQEDALALAKNLDVKIEELSIENLFQGYLKELKPYFKDMPFNKAEENIQARIRGNIAMAFSNKFGYMVLSTGNKSELSVGYATLYGDMAGGFSVLKDVYKTEVYRLAKYRNKISDVIPERILTKAPSAELRPGQKDQDALPEYEMLDAILKLYIEEHKSVDEIIVAGYDADTVNKVVRMVDANEYKRRQAPPGIKITPRAFGRDRRMPITQGYLEKK
ncbi:MAG: NAD+ synthase [Actinobacteria bacterium]|nr:MAG: NAD+ synthase [Actinomycetota bacterium]